MGTRPAWRRPPDWLQPGAGLAALEVVASEHPQTLAFLVESLAASPARLEVLELLEVFGVQRPAGLAAKAARAAAQLDRLELLAGRRWEEPRQCIGEGALPASILSRFADARALRWAASGRQRPPALVRVNRRLRAAARKERAAALVQKFLSDPPR